MTVLSILIVFTYLFVWAWIRSFKRKMDNTISTVHLYLCSPKMEVYYIFSLICYLICVLWTLVAYPFFDHKNVLVTGFVLPAILFCFFNIFIVYERNNYHFIEDVDGLNDAIKTHNKRVDTLKKKARDLIKDMEDKGFESVLGKGYGKLVKKVI